MSIRPDAISSNIAVKSEPSTEDPAARIERDDPVIRTIDVYISPSLASTLHLLQFPIEPASTPRDPKSRDHRHRDRSEPIDAKFRPAHRMLELRYAVPDGAVAVADRPLPDTMCLSSRTFRSSHVAPVTHTALAKLDKTGTRLDVVPVAKGVLQMRPSFHHLHLHDDEEEDRPDGDASAADSAAAASGRQKSPALQKKDAERSAQRHRNSYAYKRASEESEDWIPLDVRGNLRDGKWTAAKKEAMERVKCPDRERDLALSRAAENNEGYVRSLNYLDSAAAAGSFASPDAEDLSEWAPSGEQVRRARGPSAADDDFDDEAASVSSAVGPTEKAAAELAAKLAVLLQNGNGTMIPYPVIRSRLKADAVSDQVLTMALSSCAVLVRGNFCLKSSLAQFLNVGGSGNNRGRAMRELRDFILLLLNMHGMVQRERLIRVYADRDQEYAIINPESITFLLQTVAKRSNGNNCWIPKVEDDENFAATFPEVAAFHGVYWVKKKERMKKLVVLYESATDEWEEEDE